MMARWLAGALCLPLFAAELAELPLTSLDGGPVRMATAGRITVVTFLSTKCPVSNDYNERMEGIFRDYQGRGVAFVFVNSNVNESAAEIREHARQAGFSFTVYKDERNVLADMLGAEATPESYLIGPSGAIRYRGSIDDARNPARIRKQGLRDALDAIAAGRSVDHPVTKAFGCTIKRVKSH